MRRRKNEDAVGFLAVDETVRETLHKVATIWSAEARARIRLEPPGGT
jgi:hypothetical protein